MEELLKVLEDVTDEVDFTKEEHLIDDGLLTSFDILQIISALDDAYGILRLFFEEKYDKFVVAERVLCCEPAGRWSDSVEDYPSGSRGRTRNALGRLYRCVGSNPMSSANYEI